MAATITQRNEKTYSTKQKTTLCIFFYLTAFYGLRRSEVIGLKWSAIDFTSKTISIKHKVVQDKNTVQGMDVMKTKSSYRTLPLIPQVEAKLLEEKAKQEEMKKVMRRAYNKKYEEYICICPSILRENEKHLNFCEKFAR